MGAVVDDAGLTLLEGDCRAILPTLPEASVQCVVTSPPYWGLRDYGTATWDGGDPACDHVAQRRPPVVDSSSGLGYPAGGGPRRIAEGNGYHEAYTAQYRDACGKCGARRIDSQLGLEPTPAAYLAEMVGVFRAVRRVLRDDGTLWLNMGDCYANTGNPGQDFSASQVGYGGRGRAVIGGQPIKAIPSGLKPKDLVGMPWRLAFALQADGWYLRADIIWAKPNPMPESVTDRPTKAHEYVFLLTKSARYFYDADAVREPNSETTARRWGDAAARTGPNGTDTITRSLPTGRASTCGVDPAGRNLRSVWTIPSAPFPDAHFATFPPALASRCIQAGSSEKGCCAACGAPWARVVATSGNGGWQARYAAEHAAIYPDAVGMIRGRRVSGADRPADRQMTGWTPTCPCAAPVTPCTVLDPFAGSGTTGQVAEQLGRHSILIELSPAYVALAEQRTAQRGLFAMP